MKTKPLISWSGPEDVKEMIAAPELQTEFHFAQWVHRHTGVMNTDCGYACVHTFTLITSICLCEQGHWHPILIRHWFRWSWWRNLIVGKGKVWVDIDIFDYQKVFTRFHKGPLHGLLPLFHGNGSGANNWPGLVNLSWLKIVT